MHLAFDQAVRPRSYLVSHRRGLPEESVDHA